MQNIFRILDANFNRAREGLRVVEEVVRFALNDATLSLSVKEARHSLQVGRNLIPGGGDNLVFSRDVAGDMGARGITRSEMGRASLKDLVTANLARVQEAARVLEEFSKFLSPDAACHFKEFRFAIYALEKDVVVRCGKKTLLDFQLYVIVGDDGTIVGRDIVRVAADAVKGGAGAIQMRIKNGKTSELLQTGRRLRELCTAGGVTFIVNDRPDIALAVNADGVHLGQDDLPVGVARRIMGPDKLVGVSTHSVEQARAAAQAGADYIGVGSVFATTTKEGASAPVGTDLLKLVSDEVAMPVVAIGGIKAGNAADVIKAGVTRCAVISAVTAAQDVVSAASELSRGIESAIREYHPSHIEERGRAR